MCEHPMCDAGPAGRHGSSGLAALLAPVCGGGSDCGRALSDASMLELKARAAAWTGTGSRLAFRSLACRAVRDLRWPDPAARYVREAGAQRTRRRVPTSSSGPPARAGVRPFRVADVVRDTLIDRPSAIAWERSLNGRAAPARL